MVDGLGRAREQLDALAVIEHVLVRVLRDRQTLDELHREIGQRRLSVACLDVRLAGIEEGRDPGMPQSLQETGFLLEAAQDLTDPDASTQAGP